MLRRALRLRSTRAALVVGGLVGLALSPSPLLGVHGVESALVLGILLPPFAAALGARLVISARHDGAWAPTGKLLGGAVAASLIVLAVPVLILGINSLVHVRSCTPLQGLAFVLLGPGVGVAAAATAGVVVASVLTRPRLATTLAVLVPIAGIVVGVWRFWSTPAIFVYAHFVGWFPGTIYDEGVSIPVAFLGFRAVTMLWIGAAGALLTAGLDEGLGRLHLTRLLANPGKTSVALVLVGGAIAAEAHGEPLGFRTSASYIAEELGAEKRGERCIVHAPRELHHEELDRLVADCDYRVQRSEAELGVRHEEPVTAFLFRHPDEKRRLMGAAHTYIAKPWRDEVYLQLRNWPHPVLFHEVAHVVAGSAAEGPFRVGGQLGGWLPDPALIEGAAVAIAWDVRQGLTPHEWARAMLELDLMPPLEHVVGLSFLTQPARNAYTVAGSFLRYLLDTYGADVVRKAYRTGDVEAAVGKPIETLEQEWHAHLEDIALPPDALALAELRFSQRSIFSAVCPHRVADLESELREDFAAGDIRRARGTCEEILDIDPAAVVTRARYVGALALSGALDAARAELETLESEPPAPAPVRVMAREALADDAWRRGGTDDALTAYRALLELPQTDDAARQIEVKVLGLEAGGAQAELLFTLLVGEDGVPASSPLAVHVARELASIREDGLGPYLEARQLMGVDRYGEALDAVREARRRGLPTLRLREEARRMEGVSLYAVGRFDESRALWRSVLEAPETGAAERVEARDWLERIP